MTEAERKRRLRALARERAVKPAAATNSGPGEPVPKPTGPVPKPGPDHRDQEIANLRARIRAVEQERDRYKQMAESGVKQQPSNAAETELIKARAERDEALNRYWEIREYVELRTEGIFTRKEFNKVRAMLHPDRVQDEAEQKRYAEAFDIFRRCEKLLKNEPLPKPPGLPRTGDEWREARLRVKRGNRERALKAAAARARKKPGRQLAR
jgi:hypothetical protein